MKSILSISGCVLCGLFCVFSLNAKQKPLVYSVENTGAKYDKPVLPALADLPVVETLTDPFAWSNGRGRSTKFKDWSRRRAEIGAEIGYYEIGEKQVRPDTLDAVFADNKLTVKITRNGHLLELHASVIFPEGDGPFPAVIGMGGGTGSLPADIFTSRQIAIISFNFSEVMQHSPKRGEEPYNQLYPGSANVGSYTAWPWGVSRIIDGIEIAISDRIDVKHLAVTGCSFAGKMALFAGAFDERIALTIAQEPGGGGAAAWRVSDKLPVKVETLRNAQGSAWYRTDVSQFNEVVTSLPYDHHELMAMVAPRALLVLGNPDYEWLAEESGYVSCRAAAEVWKTFDIADRFGFSIVTGHGHCQLPDSQKPEVIAFVEKFLLGKEDVDTHVATHPFPDVDYQKWTKDWAEKSK